MTLHFSTGASEDLVQHLTYLGEQSKQAQLDFYNELNGALELISGYPEISPKVRGGIHRFTILRSPSEYIIRWGRRNWLL